MCTFVAAPREGKVKAAWPSATATGKDVQQDSHSDRSDDHDCDCDHIGLKDLAEQRRSHDKKGYCDTGGHCIKGVFGNFGDSGDSGDSGDCDDCGDCGDCGDSGNSGDCGECGDCGKQSEAIGKEASREELETGYGRRRAIMEWS